MKASSLSRYSWPRSLRSNIGTVLGWCGHGCGGRGETEQVTDTRCGPVSLPVEDPGDPQACRTGEVVLEVVDEHALLRGQTELVAGNGVDAPRGLAHA